MKKLIAAVLSAALLLALAACGQRSHENEIVGTGEPEEDALVGAWEKAVSPVITDKLRALVEKAQEDLTGAGYVPVAYLATQIVAGRNHAVLCRETRITSDPAETYAVVILYEDLEGNVTISDVQNFGAETYLHDGDLTGGWTQPETPEITEEAGTAFEKAMEGFTGVDYVPVALLSTQLVAGMNYRYICESAAVLPGAEKSYALVTVYQDLKGNAEITEVVRLPETETSEASAE